MVKEPLAERMLGAADRAFLIFFSRYRRENGDRSIEAARRKASNRISAFLLLPSVGLVGVVALLAYVLTGVSPPLGSTNKLIVQAGAVFLGLYVIANLERRFRRFLVSPPHLPKVESQEDKRFIFFFC